MTGTIIIWLVIAILAAIAIWLVGSIALRLIGLIVTASSLLDLGITASTGHFTSASGASIAGLLAGPALWLGGNWLSAFKHHHYKSPLAQRTIAIPFSGRLDPTRKWGIRTTD